MPKIAYLDCRAGISAPLLLAALLDIGTSFDVVEQQLHSLSLSLERESVQLTNIRGTSCIVRAREDHTFAECLARLQKVAQPMYARVQAVLSRLLAAEKAVTSSEVFAPPIQTFGEIVSVISALYISGITQLYASPLPFTGSIQRTPGELQVQPHPLVQELLRPVSALWQPSFEESAVVTPVAAALLAELALFERPVMTLERVGYGFLSEKAPSLPVSLYLGQQFDAEPLPGGMEADQVTVIETHIDTMSGELLGALLDRLLEAGALDVGYTPLQMKKNRPGTRLTIICPDELAEHLALLLLRETNTLGLRIQQVQRRKAQRRQERIETSFGPMLVKIKSLAGEIISVSPEYEECLRIAKERQLPLVDVYEVARTATDRFIIQRKSE